MLEQNSIFTKSQKFCLKKLFEHNLLRTQQLIDQNLSLQREHFEVEFQELKKLYLSFHSEKAFFLGVFDSFRDEVNSKIKIVLKDFGNQKRRYRIMMRVKFSNF